MTYHNRLLTTPQYVNDHPSPYWSYLACEAAFKTGEACAHSHNFKNLRVYCDKHNLYFNRMFANHILEMKVECKKCDMVFRETQIAICNLVRNYGF